jgi:hypothetical protein
MTKKEVSRQMQDNPLQTNEQREAFNLLHKQYNNLCDHYYKFTN